MKFFALIMAFLLLALTCWPCADGDSGAHNEKAQCEKLASTLRQAQGDAGSASGSEHHNDKDHEEDCSPFCNCTCCAGFSVNHHLAGLSALFIFSSKKRSAYLPADISEVTIPVWQPPKVS